MKADQLIHPRCFCTYSLHVLRMNAGLNWLLHKLCTTDRPAPIRPAVHFHPVHRSYPWHTRIFHTVSGVKVLHIFTGEAPRLIPLKQEQAFRSSPPNKRSLTAQAVEKTSCCLHRHCGLPQYKPHPKLLSASHSISNSPTSPITHSFL